MIGTLVRMKIVGVLLVAGGLTVAGVGFLYGLPLANDGLDSAQAQYEAQGVMLSYNEDGVLVDRGTPEGAEAIISLLRDDWDFPVNMAHFDPDDPVVNTRDELMFQYATITYHVLHGEVQVVLTADQVPITYRGVSYDQPGTYPIQVEEYYSELDRTHPIEGQLRGAWTAQALALTSFLAGGHANQAVGELAQATSLGVGSLGLLFALAGGGLVWVASGAKPHADRPDGPPGRRVMPEPKHD